MRLLTNPIHHRRKLEEGMSPSGLVSMAVMHDRLIGCGLSGIQYSGAPGWKAKSCTQLNCRQIKFSWAGRDFSKLNF